MYRLLLTILYLKAASSAPQPKESDVTYVKIQPVIEDTLASASNLRESRIEKLPLTIPGNVTKTDSKEPDKNISYITNKSNVSEITHQPENKSDWSEHKVSETLSESLDLSETKQTEAFAEASATKEASTDTTDDLPETSPTDDASESDLHLSGSDGVPTEGNLSDRRGRNFDSLETTETAEDITERYEEEFIYHTATDAPRTRVPPKFLPKGPKLSYFQKPKFYNGYSSNLLENGTKRKFRSHCSCQKIWNCPKLQISVPRCPNEYFLCCF